MRFRDSGIWPEPIRSSYSSDEEHARAWLEWAERTPGGWRARLADKITAAMSEEDDSAPDDATRVHVVHVSDAPPDETDLDSPTRSTELVGYVAAPSPCCEADVIVDPLITLGRRGLCVACGAVLDHVGSWWEPMRRRGDV
jgi:hypothetical protein